MSLSVAGVWQVGVWDQTVWADGVWREGAVATATQTKGGIGPSVLVRPVKRHKKLDTFREELERLVAKTEQTLEDVQPDKATEQAIVQAEAIVERFNIVQTFDDQNIISSQMELLHSDLQQTLRLLSSIALRKPKEKRINEEEIIIAILATEF